jgi:membrane protease YdiL (CAAX protease family)
MGLAIGFLPAFLLYTVHLVASSVIYSWSYNETGSLLMPIILHGSLNTAAWFFGTEDIPVVGILPLIFLIIFEVIGAGFIIKFSDKDLGWHQALDVKREMAKAVTTNQPNIIF